MHVPYDEQVRRYDATEFLNNHIKNNRLQNKNRITMDADLRKLFPTGTADTTTFLEMTMNLNAHILEI